MPTPSPTFSVIIPNYNNAATLARAVASVLEQRCPVHEIIVIDDGSTDDSRRVAQQFGDQIRYVRQDNAGVSAARNRGAELASGDWLAFLDADDCYYPGRIQAHADWIARDPGLDFLLGDQDFVSPDGEFMHRALASCLSGQRLAARHPGAVEIPMDAADFEDLIADGFGEIRTLSVPRTTFLALGGFPVGKKIGEDLHLVIRLCARSSRAGVVNAPLAAYYVYPTSALRKDILGAQCGFVDTLAALAPELRRAHPGIRKGYREKLRRARLSLAYSYLRAGRKREAIGAVLPTLLASPGPGPLRDVLSVLRGMPAGGS